MIYSFTYTATPAEHNQDFWIDIRNKHTEIIADNLKDACMQFAELLDDKWCIRLTKNGIKTAAPMYRDRENAEPQQVGYVFNAHTEIDFGTSWKHRNIMLWTTIKESRYPEFEN